MLAAMRALADHDLARLLDEDVPAGDLTTAVLGIGGHPGWLILKSREAMTVCAVEEAARLFELCGANARILRPTGSQIAAGVEILAASGPAAALHHAYKTAQVLIEWTSGIATATSVIVAAAGKVPVACTRKNVPGTKFLSVKAVKAGGATMHRLGLSETLLLFDEHRLFLDEAPAVTIARMKQREPEKKIVVEVASPEDAMHWARAGADVLQLEKFPIEQVAQCRLFATTDFPGIKLAATGGIDAGNAAAYAAAGADLLVTTAPYMAPRRDVKVTFGLA